MTRSLHRAFLGGLGLFGLAALAACSLLPAPAVVTLEVLGKRNAPADAAWVAVRDARGAWQVAPSSVPGTYDVPTDGMGRFSVAIACASDPPTVTVLRGTAGEIQRLTTKCEATDDEEGCGEASVPSSLTPQAFLFTIDATGVPADQRAFVYFHGSPIVLDEGAGSVNVSMGRDNVLFFTAVGPENAKAAGQPDPNGITAFHWGQASHLAPDVHVVASGEGTNMSTPLDGLATFTGTGSDSVTARATLKLPHEVRVPLGAAPSGQLAYHGVPDGLAQMVHEAATMLSATALGPAQEAGGQRLRSAQFNLASTAATPSLRVALLDSAFAPVERFSNGVLRWTAYNDPQAGPAQAYSVATTIGPPSAPTLVWNVIVTPRWLSVDPDVRAAGTLEYRPPDLRGLNGIDDAWRLPPDATGSWALTAMIGRTADGSPLDLAMIMKGHGVEEAGAVLLSAGREGPL